MALPSPTKLELPAKGVVPPPKVVKDVITKGVPVGGAAGGLGYWDWVAAHPWETAGIALVGTGVVGGAVYALNRWHQARHVDLACQPDRRAVISGLINAYKAKLDAANTQDHIAADLAAKEIEAEIAARKEASAIIIAEQGRWYTAIIRPLLAFPIIIYFWKVIVWDKVLGFGTTDPITGLIADWTGMIITAYVGGRSIEKVARIFRR